MKLYAYKNCDTCRKAKKWLDARGIGYQEIPIREQPPSRQELRRMLKYTGDVRKLFNTSGGDYKSLKLKDRLPNMSEAEAIELLATNGNLVKRPFVIGTDFGTVGFRESAWETLFAR